ELGGIFVGFQCQRPRGSAVAEIHAWITDRNEGGRHTPLVHVFDRLCGLPILERRLSRSARRNFLHETRRRKMMVHVDTPGIVRLRPGGANTAKGSQSRAAR